ncbi:hypothetical protein SAMN02787144_1003356 [Streptomyces atratus]|uniref:Uncharacterized protein n=1 Tax=Streptomyces atratus TaxID=1893 RepID=A0A1K1XK61_STRAR|nr:hypothetical protein SAMN02787144_1003356 [Streptomyces atratus]
MLCAMAGLAAEVRDPGKCWGQLAAVDGPDLGSGRAKPSVSGRRSGWEEHARGSRDEGAVPVLGVDPAHTDCRWHSRPTSSGRVNPHPPG